MYFNFDFFTRKCKTVLKNLYETQFVGKAMFDSI